ncbi:MAG: hypothetical protein J6B87_04320 [Clostridia bacterium]|nr:hypothetical protein [Clostridia bacterium]
MISAIVKFFKALFTVFVGLLILAAVIVALAVILKFCGLEIDFIKNIAVWILNTLSRGIVLLYNIIVH